MTERPLIRIVDDDEALAASSALLLESMGWETAAYSSGEDFLARGDFARPGCIILDVQMPGLDGLAVHEKLLELGSTVPVLFLT
ncbi:response regulator transcription factor, partial [Sutterella sp.]|uniref:response regulator transcription factor n=1 Tax=Sutterella sp. TaxID=1981025 RepID=UPI003FD74F40